MQPVNAGNLVGVDKRPGPEFQIGQCERHCSFFDHGLLISVDTWTKIHDSRMRMLCKLHVLERGHCQHSVYRTMILVSRVAEEGRVIGEVSVHMGSYPRDSQLQG